jgi:Cytochrome P460
MARFARLIVSATALAVAGGVAVAGGAGKDSHGTSFPGVPTADQRAIQGFEGWTRLTAKPPARLRSLGSAHHAGTHRIYASPPRSKLVRNGRQRFPYPVGTVIVKTNTTDGYIDLIAIMKKVARGTDTAKSWEFIEYQRSSANGRFSPIGEAACTGCHTYANGGALNGRTGPRTDSVFYTLK